MRQLVVAAWILAWVASSVSLILTNKFLLSYTKFQFPFTLALWHMVLAGGSSHFAMTILNIPDAIQQHINRNCSFSIIISSSDSDRGNLKHSNGNSGSMLLLQLASIGLLFGISLVLSNWSFMYLSVPTIQMLKASTPAIIYLAGVCLHNEHLQLVRMLKVLVVCSGVAMASYGDITVTLVGVMLQLCGVIADALRICFLQKVFTDSRLQAPALVTLAHVAPYTAASLVLPMAAFEGRMLVSTYTAWKSALPAVVLSGMLATSLNLVVFQLVQLTSALTTSLSGVIKECVCILVAMHVYHTVISSMQWYGYFIAVAGLVWYQQGCQASADECNSPESNAGRSRVGNDRSQDLNSGTGKAADGKGSSSAQLLDACERNAVVS